MWMIALQADLRCAPKFSASAPNNFQSGATVLLVKIVSLEPCVGGTKRQQSFLFGSEELNALVSSDESMLSKCDDVITYTTEPLNIQVRPEISPKSGAKHSDSISGSKVINNLRTIGIFWRGQLSLSLRVKGRSLAQCSMECLQPPLYLK